MKLSKEIIDLECSKKLNFNKEFQRITESDTEFAKILEYYEDEIVKLSKQDFGTLSLTNKAGEEYVLVRADQMTNLVHRLALNLYRILTVQAEIDEVERECGTKED